MTQKIFISYRRGGVRARTYRMADTLKQHFGEENVFLDIDSIAPGARFADVIRDSINSSTVVLIMIGPNWANMQRNGQRRLDDPKDNLRIEVETALQSNALVIPVLVNGAEMPEAEDLPDAIAELSALNAAGLSDSHWAYDLQQLVSKIDPEPEPGPVPQPKKDGKLNKQAIASLAISVLILLMYGADELDLDLLEVYGVFTIVAFGMSFFAYRKTRAEGNPNKALAIWGMVLAVAALVVLGEEYDEFATDFPQQPVLQYLC